MDVALVLEEDTNVEESTVVVESELQTSMGVSAAWILGGGVSGFTFLLFPAAAENLDQTDELESFFFEAMTFNSSIFLWIRFS